MGETVISLTDDQKRLLVTHALLDIMPSLVNRVVGIYRDRLDVIRGDGRIVFPMVVNQVARVVDGGIDDRSLVDLCCSFIDSLLSLDVLRPDDIIEGIRNG